MRETENLVVKGAARFFAKKGACPMLPSLSWRSLADRSFWTSRWVLGLLLLINVPGTIYGYIWYGQQLVWTVTEKRLPMLLPFVPDSPTASLFFTLAIGILYLENGREPKRPTPLRSFAEAFAVLTSFKYGIWAVAMIAAGAMQGDALQWQDYMLIVSHLGMALEALLFAPWFRYGLGSALAAGLWTLFNDLFDYSLGIFPWLYKELLDDLPAIALFTVCLTLFSLLLAVLLGPVLRRRRRTGQV
ncbi:hypothetical protein GCM10027018_09300 [Paenibacillus thermoaerophilus]